MPGHRVHFVYILRCTDYSLYIAEMDDLPQDRH